jgi:hypothetical protein
LRADGKDIRDYVEADHIDELFRRDLDERARRERERGRMARMRSGQEPFDSDENTRSSLFFFFLLPRLHEELIGLLCFMQIFLVFRLTRAYSARLQLPF